MLHASKNVSGREADGVGTQDRAFLSLEVDEKVVDAREDVALEAEVFRERLDDKVAGHHVVQALGHADALHCLRRGARGKAFSLLPFLHGRAHRGNRAEAREAAAIMKNDRRPPDDQVAGYALPHAACAYDEDNG